MDSLSIGETQKAIAEGARVIDTRPSAIFLSGFIPQSIHMPVTGHTKEYAELLIEPSDDQLLLLTAAGQEDQIARDLLRTGFVNLSGVIEGGYEAWVAANEPIDLIIDITMEEFEIDYKFDEFYLIDLRADDEYEAEHLEHAESIPLADVETAVADLQADQMYYLYGSTFEEAAVAASLFKRAGLHKLRIVNEGYDTLKTGQIPVIKKKKPRADPNFSSN